MCLRSRCALVLVQTTTATFFQLLSGSVKFARLGRMYREVEHRVEFAIAVVDKNYCNWIWSRTAGLQLLVGGVFELEAWFFIIRIQSQINFETGRIP